MIETGLKELDKFLGGGIKEGLITSISGQSATGKTQLIFQICVNALHMEKRFFSKIRSVSLDLKDLLK